MENEYTRFNVEDFVADEGFVDWVKTNKNETFWSAWLEAHPEKNTAIEEARRLILELGGDNGAMAETKKTRLWKRIDKSTTPVFILRRLYLTAAVAAACFAVFYVAIYPREKASFELVNQQSDNLEHVMPDQSIVVLAPGSKVLYDKNNFATNREIKMEGKAFFEVEKGSPFTVTTPKGKVEVLGTSFDVDALSGDFKVRCFTGKVRVEYQSKSTLLLPGEQTDFKQATQFKSPFELPQEQQPEWMQTVVKFDRASLQEVIATLERIYEVKVEVDAALLDGIQHTGVLIQNDLEKALVSITWPHHLTFELEGDEVKIFKKVD